jgi:fructose-bisphosphate aldolase class II
MIINPKKQLEKARENSYAIGAFNTSDIEITQAIMSAAKRLNAPIMIQTSEKAIDYAGLENIYDVVKNESKKLGIDVALHLDHGSNLEIVKRCLEIGYKSVMIDGSKLLYEKNVELTKKVVLLAKKYGAQVEGEIGTIGGVEDDIKDSGINCTDPNTALDFVKLTQVNSLAIGFGNAHGIPNANEVLDFKLLEEIYGKVKIPLVFHGASSTPVYDMKRAISLGMAKINIDTDIRLAFAGSIKKFQEKFPEIYDPRKIMENAKVAVEKVVVEKIELFGSKNKL